MNCHIANIFLLILVKAEKYECLNGLIVGDKGLISNHKKCIRARLIIFLEIIEDQGILTVYGLMEHRFLDELDDLGLD